MTNSGLTFFQHFFDNWTQEKEKVFESAKARHELENSLGIRDEKHQLEPIPIIFEQAKLKELELELGTWAQALTLSYKDIFGEQRVIKEGIISQKELWEVLKFPQSVHGILNNKQKPINLLRFDLELSASGQFTIAQIDANRMQGLGKSIENRVVHSKSMGELLNLNHVLRIAPFFQKLKDSFFEASLRHKEEPSIMLWTSGPEDENYEENIYLSRYFGYPLVESRDLTYRNGLIFLKALSGLKPVDVLIRLTHAEELDALNSKKGLAGVIQAIHDASISIINAPGTEILCNELMLSKMNKISKFLNKTELGLEYKKASQSQYGIRLFMALIQDEWCLMPGGLAYKSVSENWVDTFEGRVHDIWFYSKDEVEQISLLPNKEFPLEVNRDIELPSRVADDLFWLGRYFERAWVDLRTIERTEGEKAHKALIYLKQEINSLYLISHKLRDRMAAEVHRILAELNKLIENNNSHLLYEISIRLGACSGLISESMTRTPAYLFLDLGRRLERAILVAEGFKSFLRNDFASHSLHALLDIFDSVMTYRNRYKLAPQFGLVFDTLVLDESNPRSIAFQLEILERHSRELPNSSNKFNLTKEQKTILSIYSHIKLLDIGNIDADSALSFLSDLESKLMSLSDSLHLSYFTQVNTVQSIQARTGIS